MYILDINDEILTEIFLLLNGKDLLNLRQVSKQFNQKVNEIIWLSPYAKKILSLKIEKNWWKNTYQISEREFRLINLN